MPFLAGFATKFLGEGEIWGNFSQHYTSPTIMQTHTGKRLVTLLHL